jgi:hypothetical protein
MKMVPSSVIENGFTAQLMKRITPTPRHAGAHHCPMLDILDAGRSRNPGARPR